MIRRFLDCELDEDRFELRRRGARVPLQPKALELLLFLSRRPGRLTTRDELCAELWPDVVVGDTSLTRLVSLARRAIGASGRRSDVIETVPGRGYRFVAAVAPEEPAPPAATDPAPEPGLVVLPLEHLGDDPRDAYFAAGLTEDLALRLGTYGWFPILSSTAGARYAVEGSVRRGGRRVRITARLVDLARQRHMLAERIETELRDVFAAQDQLTDAIVAAVEPKLWEAESETARGRPAANPGVWDAALRGWSYLLHDEPSRETQARIAQLCRRALDLDRMLPARFFGLAASGDALLLLRFLGCEPRLRPDPAAATSDLAQAAAAARRREPRRLADAIDRAVRRAPADAIALRWTGLLLASLASADRPADDDFADVVIPARALAQFSAGDPDGALETSRAPQSGPNRALTFAIHLASLAELGQAEAARREVRRMLRAQVEFTLDDLPALLATAEPAALARLRDGLARAGCSEDAQAPSALRMPLMPPS